MERHFERDLNELKERLLWMGSLAERAVHQAVHSVLDSDEQLAKRVLDEEDAINELQMEVDDRVVQLLALHQLMAMDLRFVLAVSRINNDLERLAALQAPDVNGKRKGFVRIGLSATQRPLEEVARFLGGCQVDQEGRLLSDGIMDGFVPGEGAGFLLLGRGSDSQEPMRTPLAAIPGVGLGTEIGHRYSLHPCRGDGLSAAFRTLFASTSTCTRLVASVFAGLNGENFGSKEWGAAYLRHSKNFITMGRTRAFLLSTSAIRTWWQRRAMASICRCGTIGER